MSGNFHRDDGFGNFLFRQVAVSTTDDHSPFVARNFLLDEGICEERRRSYEAAGAAADHASLADWTAAHGAYLEEQVRLQHGGEDAPTVLDPNDPDLTPETFRHRVAASPFSHSARGLHLVRIEEVGWVARAARVSPSDLSRWARAHADGDGSRSGRLDDALGRFSHAATVDRRPVFSAYWEDFQALFGSSPAEDEPGWADSMRDRLGLAHWNPRTLGRTIEILLFRYPISRVPRLRRAASGEYPLVPPTVLDGAHSTAFCPAPGGSMNGYTVDLAGGGADRREILHPSLRFRTEDLWRVGVIRRAFDPSELRMARGLHLIYLREQTGRDDYALDTDEELL